MKQRIVFFFLTIIATSGCTGNIDVNLLEEFNCPCARYLNTIFKFVTNSVSPLTLAANLYKWIPTNIE